MKSVKGYCQSSNAGESHPYVLTEPCLTVSRHTALLVQSRMYCYITDEPIANEEIDLDCSCTFSSAILHSHLRKVPFPIVPTL